MRGGSFNGKGPTGRDVRFVGGRLRRGRGPGVGASPGPTLELGVMASVFGELLGDLCADGSCIGATVLVFDSGCRCREAVGGTLAVGVPLGSLIGKKPSEYMHRSAGEEREWIHRQLIRGDLDRVLAIDMVNAVETWKIGVRMGRPGPRASVLVFAMPPPSTTKIPANWKVVRYKRVSSAARLAMLSLGELEVLRLLAEGKRRDEIAEELGRTVKAIERRRTLLGRKMGLESTVELTRIAVAAGLHRMTGPELRVFAMANCDRAGFENGFAVAGVDARASNDDR